jgi:hypothetical protein
MQMPEDSGAVILWAVVFGMLEGFAVVIWWVR